MDYYVFTCKNDFPPVNEYHIAVYHSWNDIPLKIRKEYEFINLCKKAVIKRMSKDRLMAVCISNDMVDAVIKFWSEYMYGNYEKGEET
jgi:hypothetical protein